MENNGVPGCCCSRVSKDMGLCFHEVLCCCSQVLLCASSMAEQTFSPTGVQFCSVTACQDHPEINALGSAPCQASTSQPLDSSVVDCPDSKHSFVKPNLWLLFFLQNFPSSRGAVLKQQLRVVHLC